jgi:hypothetical protein
MAKNTWLPKTREILVTQFPKTILESTALAMLQSDHIKLVAAKNVWTSLNKV